MIDPLNIIFDNFGIQFLGYKDYVHLSIFLKDKFFCGYELLMNM